ncbi:hypothetical protein TrispH2_004496 [Trichoplax sp. H2]|nr:hypothetical protein TrispH2_004496 [Trichoplax sp. H2]|eukprot:RDD43297.1 hypothetical protein TrispH2_004496 [Trichoplax sp. H2]
MGSRQITLLALILLAFIIIDVNCSEPRQFCAPDCFDWLVENCPPFNPARSAIGLRHSFHHIRNIYRHVARDLHADCCEQPGCTEETVINYYC